MDTNAYLSQIIKFQRMIENKQNESMRFRDILTSTTIEPKEDKIQTSSDKDKMSTFMAKIVDNDKEIEILYDERKKIINQLENFSDDPNLYQILYCRYVDNLTVNNSRFKIGCSKSKAYDLYLNAMEEFERVYGRFYLKKGNKRKKRTEKEVFAS